MLEAANVRFDAHEAREFGDARAQARAALAAGYRTVAVVGGDGTLSEVVNGFFGGGEGAPGAPSVDAARTTGDGEPRPAFSSTPTLALLPAGTGNDFARALEGQRASLLHWIGRLIAHCHYERDPLPAPGESVGRLGGVMTRRVDVLRGTVAASREGARVIRDVSDERGAGALVGVGALREFYCLNAVTLGVGARVAARVAAQGSFTRRLSGEARFALAALPEVARWRERRVRVSVDEGEPRELRTNLIAVVNSRFAGGGMMFSPGARVDDGLLDVVTASRLTRAALAREMTRVHAGRHVANPRVSVVRGARVLIEPATERDALLVEADGDVRGVTPLELAVVPGALRVVV
jgi:diacylglycerol kinase family enzyme